MTYLQHVELDKQTVTKAYARWATGLRPVFGAVFERGRMPRSPPPSASAGAFSRSASAPASALPHYSRGLAVLCGIDISEQMLRKAQQRVAELGLHQRRGPRGHGRRASDFPGRLVRRRGRAIRRHYGARTRRRARRIRARVEAGRRDRAGQPRRRGSRVRGAPWSTCLRRRRASSAGAPSFLGTLRALGRARRTACA